MHSDFVQQFLTDVQYPPPYQQLASPISSQPSPPRFSVITPPVRYRDYPVQVNCNNCGQSITTRVMKQNGTCAYVTSGAVCLVW